MDELTALERLVRAYSPSGHEEGAVEEFVRLAGELGYATHVDAAGNGIARLGSGRPRLLFLGHIDTVDGELPVRRRAGWLYGRGAVDAKGPLVAALFAGRGRSGPGEYRVVAAVGEETDSRGARHLARGVRPDAVIAGEPSGWDGVTLGYKGELEVVATFQGRRTHYSSPEPTAMDRAVDWVGRVRALASEHRDPSPYRSLSAKVVSLGSRREGGGEEAEVRVDLRLPPGLATADLIRTLRQLPGPVAYRFPIRVEPVEVERTNPVVEGLVAGIRAVGGRPTLYRKGGTSDLNLVMRAWGSVPGAAYGPGDAHLDHTDRERIGARDLRRGATVLRAALERLAARGTTLRGSAASA